MNLHPGVPVLGDAVRVAVKAPYDCSPVVGIVHWASVTLNETDVPAVPSVGGALEPVSIHIHQHASMTYLTVLGAAQV